MPDVADYDEQDEWMAACVPARIDEGEEQDQAVAVCLSIWRDRNKAAADPNVGGGRVREKLKDSDFVFADERKFPVVTPGDVSDAVSSWGRYKGPHSFEEFKRRLTALCRRKGPSFVRALPDTWEVEKSTMTVDNTLKALSWDEDEMRVGNYIVIFGGRDLEGVRPGTTEVVWRNQDGSRGEFFSKSTDLESTYTATGRVLLDYEHGLGKEMDGADAPGRDDVLGYVDWSTKRVDARGVWVERALDRHNEYMQWLEQLIKAGIVGTSSEAVADGVQKAADGHILKWPLRRDTLTITPMEWRNKGENVVQALKALGLVPDETAEQPEPEAEPEDAQAPVDAVKARLRLELELLALED